MSNIKKSTTVSSQCWKKVQKIINEFQRIRTNQSKKNEEDAEDQA